MSNISIHDELFYFNRDLITTMSKEVRNLSTELMVGYTRECLLKVMRFLNEIIETSTGIRRKQNNIKATVYIHNEMVRISHFMHEIYVNTDYPDVKIKIYNWKNLMTNTRTVNQKYFSEYRIVYS